MLSVSFVCVYEVLVRRLWKMNKGLSQWSSVHLSHGITMTWSWPWHVMGPAWQWQWATWHKWGHCAMVSTRLLGGAVWSTEAWGRVQPGRSGDTVADTLVDTMDRGHEKPCDHALVSIANFVATILFNSLDAFCLFTWCFFGEISFLYENYPSLLIRVAANYCQGAALCHNLCRRVARESDRHPAEVSHNTSSHSRFQARTLDPPRLLGSCLFHSQHLCQVVTSSCRHLPSFKFLGHISYIKQKETKTEDEQCALLWHHRAVIPLQ